MTTNPTTGKLIDRATDGGVLIPRLALQAADRAGIPFWVACAFLMQETGGGRNVWGHDPTWMIGYPVMTAEVYAVYKEHRGRFGNQGVGPMQLTSPGLQDQADKLGGCWVVENNLSVAFHLIAAYADSAPASDKTKWWYAAQRYNGSSDYADRMVERFAEWRKILGGGE